MNREILEKSLNKAVNGGTAGFVAMTGNVMSMMWLRTIVNHQYRNGGTFKTTAKLLYREGGILRFYRGVGFALLNAPMSRFGDTAMNALVTTALSDSHYTISQKTFLGSCCAGLWRIGIMPIDTFKSSLQVNGKNGMTILRKRIKTNGVKTLWNGAGASAFSTVMGHFPWFYTYNYLNTIFPRENYTENWQRLCRSAAIGFCSSSVSDIVSNTFRVIKVNRQVSSGDQSYKKLIQEIVSKDSVFGLMTRGLRVKIITNGIQGMVFTVLFDALRK